MIMTNITCPICDATFSVGIDIEEKSCTAKKCPKCNVEIELSFNK